MVALGRRKQRDEIDGDVPVGDDAGLDLEQDEALSVLDGPIPLVFHVSRVDG